LRDLDYDYSDDGQEDATAEALPCVPASDCARQRAWTLRRKHPLSRMLVDAAAVGAGYRAASTAAESGDLMSRRRFISTDLSTDVQVTALARNHGCFAVLLYTWMIPHCTAGGSLHGSPSEILRRVIPGRRDKEEQDVYGALLAMDKLGLITWNQEEKAIQFDPVRWRRDQRYSVNRWMRAPWDRARHLLRPRILERDSHRCRQCGSTDHLEIDHIIPIVRGESNEPDNLQVLCRPCNRRKWAS